jgi:hypothetical protein
MLLPRLAGLALSIAAICAPILWLWWSGVYLIFFVGEFIVYRLGNALAILGGETANIRPVQGFPSAILALAITAAMRPAWGIEIGNMEGLNAYAYTMLLLSQLPYAAALAIIWLARWPRTEDRLAVTVAALVPWYVAGPSPGLVIAPDYWIVEGAHALVTAIWALWLLRTGQRQLSPPHAMLVGVWASLAFLTKAPAVASVLVLLCVARPCSWRAWVLLPGGGALATAATLLLYALGDARHAWAMATFLAGFAVSPNESAMAASVTAMLLSWPNSVGILIWFGVLLVAAPLLGSPWRVALGCVFWFLPYAYLLARRIHGTSLTSLLFAVIAMLALLSLAVPDCRRRRAVCLVGLMTLVGIGFLPPAAYGQLRTFAQWAGMAAEEREAARVLDDLTAYLREHGRYYWYHPLHLWSGYAPATQLAWSGNLGFAPLEADASGVLWYRADGGRVLRSYYGDIVMLNNSLPEQAGLMAAYRAGYPIVLATPWAAFPLDDSWVSPVIESEPHTTRSWEFSAPWSARTITIRVVQRINGSSRSP